MSPRHISYLPTAAHVLKVARRLLAALVLGLAPVAQAEETRESLAQRSARAEKLLEQLKIAGAEKEYRAVLAGRLRVLGSDHPDVLASRNNLATALRFEGKNGQAEQEFLAVLAVRERVLGKSHPDVFETCFNLALALKAQGKLEEALAFAQRARDGSLEVLGAEHPYTKSDKALCEQIEAALAKKKRK